MNKPLVISPILLMLLVAGCSSNPAAAPGPPEPQREAAQGKDRDRDKDQNRNKDQNRDKDQGRSGDRDQQAQAASCPRGEHPSTDRDGRTSCVRD
jgi:hypothetical protein